jgi:nitroimidazol reductase NimA-like FMN-containing flavoprotein (pyridoxamine 5'-phosphate oxidase superfamily)
MTPERRARSLIDRNQHMIIGTADLTGTPWTSPVFYVCDTDGALYWVSDQAARHSHNIRANPAIAIVIYEPKPADAVYITARAVELDDEAAIRHAMNVLRRKPQPDRWVVQEVADVVGDNPWRIYRAEPGLIEIRAETTKNGKPVVIREPVDASPDSST